MTIHLIEAKAREINGKLSAYDFSPANYVRVVTDEGFELTLPSAFVLVDGDWYMVFAEHHNPQVFHKEDVEQIFEWQITKHQDKLLDVKKLKLKKPKKKKTQSILK